ncbi:helix-turn-helix transcriptional regulator [Paraburkholderia silvatlantica]|uniref:helix-turn-helix transcriptional regulator n=1 Tax=Paraburkholderia silvatlantica TaxID=321895 RepID=UPI001061BE02|nr:AlpA family phage regulatory protein [Paraburkholderia silvatlantica]TDR04340.1 AlpA family transcriptional regulator [Paraburkholderia silvatlantica]
MAMKNSANQAATFYASATLHPEGFSRWPVVRRLVGMGRETVRQHEQRGIFPKHVSIGPRTAAWRNADLLAWLADPAAYRAPVAESQP